VLERLFPGDTRPYPAVAFQMLVSLGEFRQHEDLNLLRLGLVEDFPEEVQADAETAAGSLKPFFAGRKDLSELYTIAIDDGETVEVDDALALEVHENGYTVHVMICDVATAIRRDTRLDLEARKRAATIYHPAVRIPMLPAKLSSEALSLVPGRRRLVLDHVFHVDREHKVYHFATVPAIAVLDRRMTYEEADEALAAGTGDAGRVLDVLWTIGQQMQGERRAQGAIQFYPVETKIRVVDSRVVLKSIDTYSPVRRLVAEFMVGAGAGVGSLLSEKGVPAIFRIQSPPAEDLNWTEDNARDPLYFADSVRKLKRAHISLQPDSHAALGLKAYCQVTSPLRRYGDLLMQRQLHSVLTTGVPLYGDGELLEAMSTADETMLESRRLVAQAERYWGLVALLDHVGDTVRALVMDSDAGRADVLLTDFGLTGRLYPRCEFNEGAVVELVVVHVQPRMDTLVLNDSG